MEAEEQEMGARWQGMGGWRHLVRTRLERSVPAGCWAISRMSGNTKPGREAATPMVTRLVLWCTYTGAPRLVTWGSRERGWDHSFLLCSSGTSTQSSTPQPPSCLVPSWAQIPQPRGSPFPPAPLCAQGTGSQGPGQSYSRTWAAGGGASTRPSGGSSAAHPGWGPTSGGPGVAPNA